MDSKGNIYPAAIVDELRKKAEEGDAGAKAEVDDLVPLDDFEAAELRNMNRAQRRAWYSNKRRKNKRFGGATRPQRGL